MIREQIDTLANELMTKQLKARLEKQKRPYAPLTTTATSLGYECERRIVYGRCFPKDAAEFSDELYSIFREGDMHAGDVKKELAELGYELVETEVGFADKSLDIAGTIDGKISINDDRNTHTQIRIPVEIKSTTGQAPKTELELRTSENGLLRRYYAQLQTYLFLTNNQFGLFLFKDKITGLWTVLSVEMDFAFVETLLKRAERVRDAVKLCESYDSRDEKLSIVPDRQTNRSECNGCPFRETLCHPADAPVDPMLIAAEPELLKHLEEREACEKNAKAFKKLDESLKDRLKLTAFQRLVIGGESGFLIEKKIQKNGVRFNIRRLSEKVDIDE